MKTLNIQFKILCTFTPQKSRPEPKGERDEIKHLH